MLVVQSLVNNPAQPYWPDEIVAFEAQEGVLVYARVKQTAGDGHLEAWRRPAAAWSSMHKTPCTNQT